MALLSSLYKHAKCITNSMEFSSKQPGYQHSNTGEKYGRVIQTVHWGATCTLILIANLRTERPQSKYADRKTVIVSSQHEKGHGSILGMPLNQCKITISR